MIDWFMLIDDISLNAITEYEILLIALRIYKSSCYVIIDFFEMSSAEEYRIDSQNF